MLKTTYMIKFYLMIFLAIGLSSCNVESIDSTELSSSDLKSSVLAVKDPMGIYAGPNLKGTVSLWHDCDNLYVQLTPTGDNPTDAKLGIFEGYLPNENGYSSEMQYNLEDANNLLWTFDLATAGWDEHTSLNIFFTAWGGDWIGENILGSKQNAPNYTQFQFDFSELNCGGCEESFSYVDLENGSYTFNYTPSEDINDALVVFTFAQSVAVSGLESWSSNGVTKQTTMNMDACTEYTWTVELLKDCNGNSPNSNVWTDFKVNDISKKNGNTPNITQACN